MLVVGIAIGIGIETGRLSSTSIPIPMTPIRRHLYVVYQSERNSDVCYKGGDVYSKRFHISWVLTLEITNPIVAKSEATGDITRQ